MSYMRVLWLMRKERKGMRKIKVIKILDDRASQTLVGNVYKVKRITECGFVTTKCGRCFFEGEYELLGDSE